MGIVKKFIKKLSWQVVVVILAGSIVWSLTMVKSGIIYDYGVGFWGPNGHDGVWHIALIKSLSKDTWQIPVYAGEMIRNYHIGFDLVVSWIHKLTFLPINFLYFQVIPLVLAVLIGVSAYRFVLVWTKSKQKAIWSLFFVYFGGSFGWVLTLVRNGVIDGESLFWSQQSVSTLINPPFALSLVLLFSGLEFLYRGINKDNKKYLTASTFLFGVLVQIKIYAGILILGALFVAGIYQIIKRKGITITKIFTGCLIISILLFPSLSNMGESSVVFRPFWFLETMMAFPDRIGWNKFAEAMVNYRLGGVWIKGFVAYLTAFAIFILGNFGTRIIILYKLAKDSKRFPGLGYISLIIYLIIAAGIILPLFLVQKGTPWNTIQFMYYSLAFSGVLAGIATFNFTSRKSTAMNRFIAVIVVVLTIPTTIGTLWFHYLPERPPAMISTTELKALNFLRDQEDGVVLKTPFDKNMAQSAQASPPRPLYLYESSAYVSAFSAKPLYMEDEVNLEITGFDWESRRNKSIDFWQNPTGDESIKFLKQNNIKYLYLSKRLKKDITETFYYKKIYENEEVVLYKVILKNI